MSNDTKTPEETANAETTAEEAPKAPKDNRKLLTKEQVLAATLHGTRSQLEELRKENTNLLRLNAGLAAENAALQQRATALQAARADAENAKLRKEYDIPDNKVLMHNPKTDEYWLADPPQQG